MNKFLNAAGAVLTRLSVGRQLSLAFGAVLSLTAAIGVVSLWSLARLDSSADELHDKWLKGVGALAQLRAAVVESREFEIKFSRATDRSYQSEYEEKFKGAAKAADTAWESYQALPADDEDKALASTLSKAWQSYRKASDQVLSLGHGKKQQDAADISDGVASMAIDETIGALDKLAEFNFKHASNASERANSVYSRGRHTMLVLLVASLLVGVGLALWFTRRLLAQLGGQPAEAVAMARAVAAGNLATAVSLRAGDSHSLLANLRDMQHSLARAVTQV